MATPIALSLTAHEGLDSSAVTVMAATLFNMALCFFYTQGLPVGSATVIALCEVLISIAALTQVGGVITDWALVVMLTLMGYLVALWLLRQGSGPKIVRDLMIPFVYYFLGVAKGTPRRVDGLVRLLLLIVLAFSVLEWLNVALYIKLFNISSFFQAKGMIEAADAENAVTGTGLGLYISGMRIDGRNFLPFLQPILGLHRVSSVFLEPIEMSNFAVICYAWLLCRSRDLPFLNTTFYMLVCLTLIAFCDSRFASVVCVIITLCYLTGLSRQPVFVALLPLLMCGLTLLRANLWRPVVTGDDLMGRLYISGSLLASFTASEWFGLRESLGQIGDAGYAYLVTYAGFLGAGALWVVFLAGSGKTRLAQDLRGSVAIYATVLLTVSYGMFSIKTAALLWYLYGAVANTEAERSDV